MLAYFKEIPATHSEATAAAAAAPGLSPVTPWQVIPLYTLTSGNVSRPTAIQRPMEGCIAFDVQGKDAPHALLSPYREHFSSTATHFLPPL